MSSGSKKKKSFPVEIVPKDIVVVKFSKFPWWPAEVQTVNNNSIEVVFFGEGTR
jgi:hypothetical protein